MSHPAACGLPVTRIRSLVACVSRVRPQREFTGLGKRGSIEAYQRPIRSGTCLLPELVHALILERLPSGLHECFQSSKGGVVKHASKQPCNSRLTSSRVAQKAEVQRRLVLFASVSRREA